MNHLDKAIEEIKKGRKLKIIARKYELSDDEKDLLELAFLLASLPQTKLKKKEKRRIYDGIRKKLPETYGLKLFTKRRLVIALVSLFILSSAVVATASSTSTPGSPLYPIKETYRTVVSKIFKGSTIHKKILVREIKDYEEALRNPKIKNALFKKELRKKLKIKRKELSFIEASNTKKGTKTKLKEIRNKIRKKSMPVLKEIDKNKKQTTIPPLNKENQEENRVQRRTQQNENRDKK